MQPGHDESDTCRPNSAEQAVDEVAGRDSSVRRCEGEAEIELETYRYTHPCFVIIAQYFAFMFLDFKGLKGNKHLKLTGSVSECKGLHKSIKRFWKNPIFVIK